MATVQRSTVVAVVAALTLAVSGAAYADEPVGTTATDRASVASDGTEGNDTSSVWVPAISADGRFVAFSSGASNLVPGDTNGLPDVFVRDRRLHITTRVSVAADGTQGDGGNANVAISADGRYVAFASGSSNLVPGDTNGASDVFVRDRLAGTVERVTVSSTGEQANGSTFDLAISANGRYVAFLSGATNLVPGDTNIAGDVFVHDRRTGITQRVNVSSTGAQADSFSFGVAISADGRYVGFTSFADNLVPGDTNGTGDVFVHDRRTGITSRVSVASDGTQGNGDSTGFRLALSADGRFVTYFSAASNLVPGDTNNASDVFVRDRLAGTTTRVSVASDGTQGNGGSFGVDISADGRFVAFDSFASNLVPGDTNGVRDVFRYDRWARTTVRLSVSDRGLQADNESYFTATSAGGTYTAFVSAADNLVPDDHNNAPDVFVRTRLG